MILPDAIYSHPIHLDYPLWRKFIHENRARFDRVIVVFTNMNVPDLDYREFIQEAMKDDRILFLDNHEVSGKQDWRNVAVNKALEFSKSDWVFFSEEDFFPMEKFWEEVDYAFNLAKPDVIGMLDGERLHPCCIFVKRQIVDKTHRDFSPIPDIADHFSKFQQDLNPDNIYHLHPRSCYHMNGLSQNLRMLQLGEEPNYQPEEFKEYCKKCLELPDIHPDFKELFAWYLEK